MPKKADDLTAIEVKRLSTQPGRYNVGTVPGLVLVVRVGSAGLVASWLLRATVGERRSEIGLGGYPAVTLAGAIQAAREKREAIAKGIDPAAARRATLATKGQTFAAAAAIYITDHAPSWRNAKHASQWANTLTTYAIPVIGAKHVKDVTADDVLKVLRPIWSTKTETATRVRQRIEVVLDWAAAQGWRDGNQRNPATWKGQIAMALPKPRKVSAVEHHAALGYRDLPAFMDKLRAAPGMGAVALQFAILTAARSGEVRGATWGEIDTDAATWTVPAARMKAGREHRVPLPLEALALLAKLPRFEPDEGKPDLLFPGVKGQPLSDMTLTACLRRMAAGVTAHGFRSTFRDWAAEATSHPPEVAEMALAHLVGNATEAAYRRGDLFDKRRALMADWGRYCAARPADNVVSIKAKAR